MMKIHLLQIAFCSLAGILSCAAADDIRTISVNFTSGSDGNYSVSSGPYIEEDVGYGSYAVKGRYWIDFTGINIDQRTGSKPQTLVSLPLKDNRGELDHYAETKLYLCSGGGIWQDNFTPINTGNGRMLHVYMDDQASRGDRSGLKLENLPFSRYTVILYFGGDAKNVPVPAYKINGNYYKSSSEGTLPATGPDDTWGDPCGAGSPNLAKNTLVVSDLTGTLTVETAHTSRGRGRLAGFQVVGILSSGSGAAYTAELVDSVNWSTRQNGFQNESGVWNNGADSIVVITNNCFEPKMLTFDETFRANSFILA